jgi:hypothetical protein
VSPRGAVQQLADGKPLFAHRLGHLFARIYKKPSATSYRDSASIYLFMLFDI